MLFLNFFGSLIKACAFSNDLESGNAELLARLLRSHYPRVAFRSCAFHFPALRFAHDLALLIFRKFILRETAGARVFGAAFIHGALSPGLSLAGLGCVRAHLVSLLSLQTYFF